MPEGLQCLHADAFILCFQPCFLLRCRVRFFAGTKCCTPESNGIAVGISGRVSQGPVPEVFFSPPQLFLPCFLRVPRGFFQALIGRHES